MLEEIFKTLVEEAKLAVNEGEVPISAVIVKDGEIIAKAHNLKEKNNLVVAHAEILALTIASKKLQNWRLDGCDIYISLEPCTMCASALHQARINNIYFFVPRDNCGNLELLKQIAVEKNCNKKTNLECLQYKDDLKKILQDFFKNRR